MIFITGGSHQGKLDFARQALGLAGAAVADGAACPFEAAFTAPVLHNLHLLAGRMLAAGLDPQASARQGVEQNPGIIIICDELGCGIVPMEARDRHLREQVGRLACLLAGQAEAVYRVSCGIGIQIK